MAQWDASRAPLSWDAAMDAREGMLFKQFTQSDTQQPTRKRFSLLASPTAIGMESVGLGLYFATMLLFVVLMFFASLVALYPVLSNINADNYSSTYDLVVRLTDNSTIPAGTCEKEWEVTNFLLNTTVGHFCPNSPFSNPFDCPSQCFYNVSKIQEARCQDYAPDEVSCDEQLPCTNAEFDPDDPEEYCTCCDLELDIARTKNIPVGQFWVWCVPLLLGYMVWLLVVEGVQARSAEAINRAVVTAADYSVWVGNLSTVDKGASELEKFARHYGEVVMASAIVDVGGVLSKCNEIRRTELRLEELRLLSASTARNNTLRHCTWTAGLWHWIYKRGICWHRSPAAAHEAQARALAKMRSELSQLQNKGLQGTGTGVVVFNHEAHARNMQNDHQRGRWPSAAAVRNAHLLTRGVASSAPRIPSAYSSGWGGRFVTVQRAPEPSDVLWENISESGSSLNWRRLGLWLLYLLLLALSSAAQFAITRVAEQERQLRLTSARSEDGTEIDIDGDLISELQDAAQLRLLAVTQGIVVTVINLLVSYAITAICNLEKHYTATYLMRSVITKLTIFYLFNSFVIPIVAVVTLENGSVVWFTRGGVVEAAVYIQLINAFVPDLIALFSVPRMINYHIFSKFARSQAFLNATLEPVDFELPQRYASAIKTIGLGLLYAPIQPLSPFIAFVGMLFSYMTDVIIALRLSKKPRAFGASALNSMNDLLRVLPIAYLVLMNSLYFKNEDGITAAFITGVVIWGLMLLLPIKFFCGLVREVNLEDGGTEGASFEELFNKGKRLQPTAGNHMTGIAGLHVQDAMPDIVQDKKGMTAEFYCPSVPQQCTNWWKDSVAAAFKLHSPPLAPIPELLPGQRPHTGGVTATGKPLDRRAGRVAGGNGDGATEHQVSQVFAGYATDPDQGIYIKPYYLFGSSESVVDGAGAPTSASLYMPAASMPRPLPDRSLSGAHVPGYYPSPYFDDGPAVATTNNDPPAPRDRYPIMRPPSPHPAYPEPWTRSGRRADASHSSAPPSPSQYPEPTAPPEPRPSRHPVMPHHAHPQPPGGPDAPRPSEAPEAMASPLTYPGVPAYGNREYPVPGAQPNAPEWKGHRTAPPRYPRP